MDTCEKCDASIMDGSEFLFGGTRDNPHMMTICMSCASGMGKSIERETDKVNVMGALTFGFGTAVICSLIWYGMVAVTQYEMGIVAIAVGWVVARSVMAGAGGKRGLLVQLISVLAIVFAMGLGEYLIVRHFLVKTGFKGLPVMIPLKNIFLLLFEVMKQDPLMLVFWLIAVVEGIILPAKRKLNLTVSRGAQKVSEAGE